MLIKKAHIRVRPIYHFNKRVVLYILKLKRGDNDN